MISRGHDALYLAGSMILRRVRKMQRAIGVTSIKCSYFGVRYCVDLRDLIGYEIAVRRLEREDIIRLVARFSRHGRPSIFIDVGANTGLYACTIARRMLADRIVCFEPDPENFRKLRETVQLNAMNIELHEEAVGASIGRVRFMRSGLPNSGISSVCANGDSEVKMTTLDSSIRMEGEPIALKIDVEGHETEVIRGAQRVLASNFGCAQIEARDDITLMKVTAAMSEFGWRRVDRHGINATFEK